MIDFGWFDAQENALFRFNDDDYDLVFQAKDVQVAGGILVNVNPDRVVHKRFIYNFLNFLGDIGGFQRSLSKIAFFILSICGQGGSLNSYIAGQVFKSPSPSERTLSQALVFESSPEAKSAK